jgi:hypothetical protein
MKNLLEERSYVSYVVEIFFAIWEANIAWCCRPAEKQLFVASEPEDEEDADDPEENSEDETARKTVRIIRLG